MGTVSLVHSLAEPLRSGAPCPWLPWCCGWQLDQDLLRVTRRVHHAQVWEAQEGLRRNAGHVKPVGSEPRGKHEGRYKGRGHNHPDPLGLLRSPQPTMVLLAHVDLPAALRAPEEEGA